MSDDNKGLIDRRQLMTNLAGAAILAGSGLAGSYIAGDREKVRTPLLPPDGDLAAKERIKSLTSDLWVDFDQHVNIRAGVNHPQYMTTLSPSMSAAMANFHSAHMDLVGEYEIGSCYDLKSLDGNVITFGSPASNECLVQLFGMRRDLHDPYIVESLEAATRTESLYPIEFDLRGTGEKLVSRHSGSVSYEEPAWRIRIGDDLFGAKTNHGRLASDYLVITRFASNSHGKDAILSFAGLHGPGTAATRLLFEREAYFSKLTSAIKPDRLAWHNSWQALIPVSRVTRIAGTDTPVELDLDSIIVEAVH